MNGIRRLVSKCCYPIYTPGTSNKINLIPHRLSNSHLQRSSPSLATTWMLKHGVCSSSKSITKDVTGLLKSNARYSSYIPKANDLGKIVDMFYEEEDYPVFSVGDIIQVSSLEGRVLEIGPTTTVLFGGDITFGAEKRRLIVPNDLLFSEVITNKTSGNGYDNLGCEIGFVIGELDKTHDMSKEIKNMMESNPYVLFEVKKPACYLQESKDLMLRCHLKHMDPDIYFTAKEGIIQQACEIVEKHGGTSVKWLYYSYY